MLRQSRRSAGAYEATVTATGADVGGTVAASVIVTDGRGHPVSGLPVTLTMSGERSVEAVTGDNGRAVARFAAGARGWRDVTATVTQVPEHRLLVRSPVRRRQATAAEAGVRRTLVATTRAAVRGPQTLDLKAARGTLTAGDEARVVATVAGDGSARIATGTLYGPFPSAGAAECSGAAVATATGSVAADGVYTLPAVTPGAGGFYAWQVTVDGTETSLPVSACGATTKVMARSAVTLVAPPTAAPYDVMDARVTLSGLPFGGPVDVTTALYGPYENAADASCTGSHRSVTQHRPGNGSFTSLSFEVKPGPAWYAWRSSVPEGDLWLGSTSTCGVVGTLTQVR